MQTKNLKKKGFTLVELVIVVAVIAVLSAILIPTIGCFVEEAKETNDMATVRLLNTALVEDEAANGKSATMTDALAAMAKKGYLVDRLTPRSSGEILWDSVSNRFMLIKGDEVLYRDNSTAGGENYELWKVLDNGDALSTTYSNYLKDGYVFDSTTPISTGLDVGNNTGITAVTYANSGAAKNVIIRTNGGKLVVDATNDTVSHYGLANELNIISVASTSYHEFGSAVFAKIAEGRIVIEKTAEIGAVYIPETTKEVIVATRGNMELPVIKAAEDNKTIKTQVLAENSNTGESKDSEIIEKSTEAEAKDAAATEVVPSFDSMYVACIGWTPYESLISAIAAVPENGATPTVIRLLKDATGDGIMTKDKHPKNIIIDLGGYTYRVNTGAVGSTGTESQAMHWYDGSIVVMKNGSFVVSPEATKIGMAMQNYGTFTAENVNFDFSSIPVDVYSGFTGSNAIFNGLEVTMFCNQRTGTLTLTNCVLKLPENSVKGLHNDSGTVTLNNTKVDGYCCIESSKGKILIDEKSTCKGVGSYFDGKTVTTNTTENIGYTTYSLAE